MTAISGFRREVDENYVLPLCYAEFLTLEAGIYMLSRNVGKKLPLLAA
jgi:hypothetical protein